MKEENKQEKTLIEQKYDALFEKDENGKALDEESFLNALINLESAGKRKLFRTLLGDKTKEEVREYLQTKSREDREKIVGKDYLGKKMTISDVIDQYSEMVKNVFKTKKIKEAVKEAGIECKQVDGMILPPEGQQRLIPGSSEGGDDEEKKILKFKQYQEKSPVLFGDILTVENGIYPGDMVFFEGTDEKNALRYTGYVAIQIPKLNKTIFINDMKGEATFVCDKLVSEEDMKKSKKRLSRELGSAFHSVSYSEDKKESWKLEILDLLFGPEKGTQKFIRDKLMDENGELTEKGKERFNSNTTVRRLFKLSNGIGYQKIAGIFGVKRANKDYLQQDDAFYELSVAIFGEDHPKVIELKKRLIFPEEIKKGLIKRENERFNLKTTTLRSKFKLSNGIGYEKLIGIFLGKKGRSFRNYLGDDVFYKLSLAIFGEDNENVKKLKGEIENKNRGLEEIRKELIERENERFKLNVEYRPKFKLSNGFGYIKIAGTFGVKRANKDYLQQDDAFYELSAAIFGEDNENVKKLKQKIESKNRGLEEIRKELLEREDERFNLKITTIRSPFKLSNGFGYTKLAGIFGVKRGIPNDLIKDDAFYELSVAIFGENHPKVIELKKLLMSPEEIRKELLEREDERFNLKTTKPRSLFKLSNGFGYAKLAGIFGIKRSNLNELRQDDTFYELSAAIFGEDNDNVKKLKQKIESKNRGLEEIRKELLEREDERFNLKTTTIRSPFKLSNGFGYTKLAGIFGVKRGIPNDLIKDDAFYELSAAIFGKDHPKVIELKKLLMSPEEIRKELLEREDERFKLKINEDCRKFKLSNGMGYVAIARLFGLQGPEHDLFKNNKYYELTAAIFGENHPKVIELKKRLKL